MDASRGGVFLDGTCGGGGHTAAIAEALCQNRQKKSVLIALDRDPEALRETKIKLEGFRDKLDIHFLHSDFANFDEELTLLGIEALDGALLDLGVSSAQLDRAERGFSYMTDSPLDMRMNPAQERTAADILNRYGEDELAKIFRDYGEERYAKRIAAAVIRLREKEKLTRSSQLCDIVLHAIPAAARREKQHPAKRCFQALRIAVNGELHQLESFLGKIPDWMADGGRLSIISFHSLEDRIVKQNYRRWEDPCDCPADFPLCICGKEPKGRSLNKRGDTADDEELNHNPRSRSARLRSFRFAE